MEDWVQEALQGNRRAVAKLITHIENDSSEKLSILKRIFPHTGNGYILGITGSPGAGKSSLVDSITREIRKRDLTVGIIAVDPSSPFTGGALLGDRIRMQDHCLDKGVFIRSMGTRGNLGGLARATKEVVRVLDAFGCDVVIVETVGVGQSELDIMKIADSTLVVLTPGAGDHVQTIKAGIMEIADIFVINKSDLPGAERTASEVNSMLDLSCHGDGWRPPVVSTITLKEQGISELCDQIDKHKEFLIKSANFQKFREKRLQQEVLETVDHVLKNKIQKSLEERSDIKNLIEKVIVRELDPYEAAEEIIALGI